VVVALFDYDAPEEGELRFREGDKIFIAGYDENKKEGWWEGRKEDGSLGMLPGNYVKKFDGEAKKETKVRAVYEYTAQEDGELSFKENEEFIVTDWDEESEEGWYNAKKNSGESGLVPGNYVEKIEELSPTPRKAGVTDSRVKAPSPAPAVVENPRRSTDFRGKPVEDNPPRKAPTNPAPTAAEQPDAGEGGQKEKKNREVLVQAVFDYDAQEEGELSIKEGEKIWVTDFDETDESGWWEARKANGTTGLVPGNYVKRSDDGKEKKEFKVRSAAKYKPRRRGEIGFKKGVLLYVTKVDGENYYGRTEKIKGKKEEEGWFPANVVTRV